MIKNDWNLITPEYISDRSWIPLQFFWNPKYFWIWNVQNIIVTVTKMPQINGNCGFGYTVVWFMWLVLSEFSKTFPGSCVFTGSGFYWSSHNGEPVLMSGMGQTQSRHYCLMSCYLAFIDISALGTAWLNVRGFQLVFVQHLVFAITCVSECLQATDISVPNCDILTSTN